MTTFKAIVRTCLHCGAPENKHLGPRQWCPRYQPNSNDDVDALKAFAPKELPPCP